MSETIYPEGIRVFAPHENAPDFVKASVIISINELVKFCKDNDHLLSEYNGNKQLKIQLLDGRKGQYFSVDTYRPENKDNHVEETDDLAF